MSWKCRDRIPGESGASATGYLNTVVVWMERKEWWNPRQRSETSCTPITGVYRSACSKTLDFQPFWNRTERPALLSIAQSILHLAASRTCDWLASKSTICYAIGIASPPPRGEPGDDRRVARFRQRWRMPSSTGIAPRVISCTLDKERWQLADHIGSTGKDSSSPPTRAWSSWNLKLVPFQEVRRLRTDFVRGINCEK